MFAGSNQFRPSVNPGNILVMMFRVISWIESKLYEDHLTNHTKSHEAQQPVKLRSLSEQRVGSAGGLARIGMNIGTTRVKVKMVGACAHAFKTEPPGSSGPRSMLTRTFAFVTASELTDYLSCYCPCSTSVFL
jgi:hypothetical protein